jgi:hypothetical protein
MPYDGEEIQNYFDGKKFALFRAATSSEVD